MSEPRPKRSRLQSAASHVVGLNLDGISTNAQSASLDLPSPSAPSLAELLPLDMMLGVATPASISPLNSPLFGLIEGYLPQFSVDSEAMSEDVSKLVSEVVGAAEEAAEKVTSENERSRQDSRSKLPRYSPGATPKPKPDLKLVIPTRRPSTELRGGPLSGTYAGGVRSSFHQAVANLINITSSESKINKIAQDKDLAEPYKEALREALEERKIYKKSAPQADNKTCITATNRKPDADIFSELMEKGKLHFQCNCCSYKTMRKGDVRKHFMSKHTNEKPYKCAFCQLSFADPSVRARHQKIHQKKSKKS